jgi:hypothetical protein
VTFTHAGTEGSFEATLFAVGSTISHTIDVQDPEKSGFETARAAREASRVACAASTTYDR